MFGAANANSIHFVPDVGISKHKSGRFEINQRNFELNTSRIEFVYLARTSPRRPKKKEKRKKNDGDVGWGWGDPRLHQFFAVASILAQPDFARSQATAEHDMNTIESQMAAFYQSKISFRYRNFDAINTWKMGNNSRGCHYLAKNCSWTLLPG